MVQREPSPDILSTFFPFSASQNSHESLWRYQQRYPLTAPPILMAGAGATHHLQQYWGLVYCKLRIITKEMCISQVYKLGFFESRFVVKVIPFIT